MNSPCNLAKTDHTIMTEIQELNAAENAGINDSSTSRDNAILPPKGLILLFSF